MVDGTGQVSMNVPSETGTNLFMVTVFVLLDGSLFDWP